MHIVNKRNGVDRLLTRRDKKNIQKKAVLEIVFEQLRILYVWSLLKCKLDIRPPMHQKNVATTEDEKSIELLGQLKKQIDNQFFTGFR